MLIPTLIRYFGTGCILVLAYEETGIWTAVTFFLLIVANELNSWALGVFSLDNRARAKLGAGLHRSPVVSKRPYIVREE